MNYSEFYREGVKPMLKRISIDNFRCLVNFELSVEHINLLLGPSGTGKSTVFDVLRKLQAFIAGGKVTDIFAPEDLTRWQTFPIQRFELDIDGNGGSYKYELAIEHNLTGQTAQVAHERLWFDDKLVSNFESGKVRRYLDDGSEVVTSPFEPSQSSIASPMPKDNHTRLTWFRERMKRFIIVHAHPTLMAGDSIQKEAELSPRMENFASWYRHLSHDSGKVCEITAVLRELLDGFSHFEFTRVSEGCHELRAYFTRDGEKHATVDYRFSELSDGQRALIALYTLIYSTQSEDYTLCIDEPESFLPLRAIQPWLLLLYDLCDDGELQSLLISHHPELIDYLAVSAGYWFDGESNSPVRVRRITAEDEAGVPISELVARGWVYG
jgi:predicted ATPase